MEGLIALIQEVMHQKNITAKDIEARSGGKITDSYISDIIHSRTKSIGVEKLNALAEGMGMSSMEVFRAASGPDFREQDDPWSSHSLLIAVNRIVYTPELTQIVQKLLTFEATELRVLLSELENR
jgi:hypothetical protein